MRVRTPNGYETIRARSWPLAGSGYPRQFSNGHSVIPFANLPGGGGQAATYEMVYRTNPWVFTANQALSRGLSRLKLKTFKLDAKGNRERVRSDLPGSLGRTSGGQRLDSLLRQPEPGIGRQEWLRTNRLSKGVYGNALVIKERNDATGEPVALWRAPWKRVIVHEGENVPILGYEIRSKTGQKGKIYSPDDVIHFGRGTDLDSPIGLSPMSALKYTIALHDALWRHAVAYFANAARPSGMVQLDKGASEATIKIVREMIEQLYTSPENAGKVLVSSGQWQAITDTPAGSQLVELARLSREEIAAVYGIPQPMMGILDRAILNNTKELRNFFQRDLVGVDASDFEDDFMAQLVSATPAFAGNFIEFDLMETIKPDPEALGDLVEKTRSAMTPNEQRDKFFGLNALDLEEADTVWMPSGQIGLGIEPPAPETPKGQKPEPTVPVEGNPDPPVPNKEGDA